MISFHPQMHTELKTGCTEFHPSMRRSSKDHSANKAMTTSFIQKSSLLAALAVLVGGAALRCGGAGAASRARPGHFRDDSAGAGARYSVVSGGCWHGHGERQRDGQGAHRWPTRQGWF